MYRPPIFQENRIEILHELMWSHPFATLVSIRDQEICADHIPLVIHPELSEFGTIRGHVAKANPLSSIASGITNVLTVFQGPQAYISPSWYPSKKEHGKVVPTWNYAVVHASGTLSASREASWLLEHLEELTQRQESHRDLPWEVADAPSDYVQRMIQGIVGIEITISRLEGKWKVSQNRNEKDRTGVQQGLQQNEKADLHKSSMASLINHS